MTHTTERPHELLERRMKLSPTFATTGEAIDMMARAYLDRHDDPQPWLQMQFLLDRYRYTRVVVPHVRERADVLRYEKTDCGQAESAQTAFDRMAAWCKSSKKRFYTNHVDFQAAAPDGGWVGRWRPKSEVAEVYTPIVIQLLEEWGYDAHRAIRRWANAGQLRGTRRNHSTQIRENGGRVYVYALVVAPKRAASDGNGA